MARPAPRAAMEVLIANRKLGRTLTQLGAGLAALVAITIVIGGVIRANSDPSVAHDTLLWKLSGFGVTVGPGIGLLFVMCFLICGEQLRRGAFYRTGNSKGASVFSSFRPLPIRWHLLWAVLTTAIATGLIGIPAAAWFTGAWPANAPGGFELFGWWVIYGSLVGAVATAIWLSLAKKIAYERAVRRNRAVPERGQRFWQWFTYRWRFDLWVGGVGGLLVSLSATFLQDRNYQGCVIMAATGVVLIAASAVLAGNFWRSGRELNSGESLL